MLIQGQDRDYIMALKNNDKELTIPFDKMKPKLEELVDTLYGEMNKSTLRERVDENSWNRFVKERYAERIIKDYGNCNFCI